MNKEKLDLILIHPFPMNRLVCQGLITYLNSIFNVYFIELPGFGENKKITEPVSLEYFTKYVERKIEQTGLNQYILGGISFGFVVAHKIPLNNKCLLYLASEPFLGVGYLQIPLYKRVLLTIMTKLVIFFHMEEFVWKSPVFIQFIKRRYENVGDIILSHTNPVAFFSTLAIILNYKSPINLPDKDHILLINSKDNSINSMKTISVFSSQLKNKLLLVETKAPHFPTDSSAHFFKSIFVNEERVILDFLKNMDNSHLRSGSKTACCCNVGLNRHMCW